MGGLSRQMARYEARRLRLRGLHNQVIQQAPRAQKGVVIKTIGDALLLDFPSVVNAVQCAQEIQTQFQAYNVEKESAEQIHVRIGIHLGDIVQQNGDVFGDGVNIAARLQALAEPDTICISQKVYEEIENKLSLGAVLPLGKPKLRNIAQRFGIYLLLLQPPQGLRQRLQVQRLKLSRRVRPAYRALAAALLLIVASLLTSRYFLSPTLPTQHAPRNTQEALPLPDKPSIAIMPFVNMSNDPEQEYFSDGITEDITSSLSKISSLFVISRNSAFTYKGKAVKVQDVSREMGVRYVLEGSVRKADNQVRITVQLIDATTGEHLWSERFDRPFKDIFALQDEIVQKIVTTLKLQLTLEEGGYILRKTTDNLEAYDSLLRGIEPFFRYTPETNAQARQLWEKAVALDPQYAEAYAWLSWTYWRESSARWSTDPQTLERALTLAQQALVLDDSLPRAHSVLSFVYVLKQQYDQAVAEGEQATTLDPNNADLYTMRAFVLNSAGRPEAALKMMEQAMRLNPRYPPSYLFQLGWAYLGTGRYAEAIATLKEATSRNPNFLYAHVLLALSYVQRWAVQQNADSQTLAQATEATQRTLALNSSFPLSPVSLGTVYLWQQQYEQAQAELERAVALDPNGAMGYATLAEALSRVGRTADALEAAAQTLRLKPEAADGYLDSVSTAYYLAGRPEEAIAPLKQYLARYPNILGAHLILAAVYSEVGKEAEARAEAAEVLRINPKFSLEVHKERTPIKDPALLERHIAALRKAGLK